MAYHSRLILFVSCLGLGASALHAQPVLLMREHPHPKVNTCLLPENTVDLMYDTSTVMHLRGTVLAEVEVPIVNKQGKEIARDLHFTLESNGDVFNVHVGPLAYLRKEQFLLNLGDTVNVTGSTIADCGADIIVAGSISSPSKTLTLRDAAGAALWINTKPTKRPRVK